MFDIRKGVIYHTRGDTADFDINIDIDNESVTTYDAVMSVKKNIKDREYVFQVTATDGHINIPHETTQELPFGDYWYDIEILVSDDTINGRYITVGPYQYHLLPDVTVAR